MPYKVDEVSISWVSTDQELREAAGSFDSVVAIDSEFKRTNTYYPIPALYQIAMDERVFLVDPISIREWGPLIDFLEDDSKLKVFHACQEDLELLYSHMTAKPKNVFDTQFAYAFVSDSYSLSYANLVEKVLGINVNKNETRSDWLQRPLSKSQIRYAVEDAIYLIEIYQEIRQKLIEKGRLHWFSEDIPERVTYQEVEPSKYYRLMKRAWQLEGPELSVLRDLGQWREERARTKNVPRRRIVWDEHLVAFAKIKKLTETDILQVVPRGVFDEFGLDILECHKKQSVFSIPQKIARPMSGNQNRLVKMLREIAQAKADQYGCSIELFGRKKDLEECVRSFQGTGNLSTYYHGWRSELLADEFKQILAR